MHKGVSTAQLLSRAQSVIRRVTFFDANELCRAASEDAADTSSPVLACNTDYASERVVPSRGKETPETMTCKAFLHYEIVDTTELLGAACCLVHLVLWA
jgi:hypothetical protein